MREDLAQDPARASLIEKASFESVDPLSYADDDGNPFMIDIGQVI